MEPIAVPNILPEHRSVAAFLDYPAALEKACFDQFDYAVHVRGVGVICFERADPINREWVKLKGIRGLAPTLQEIDTCAAMGRLFERGMDVRVADIVWVADAPFGS